mmetsp:Transcript_8047/g.9205  ORF Transcript_8047/g.9205 Transcript_8047/m.9205 type:complete len:242 (-) Transcript_8047:341-1066(-)
MWRALSSTSSLFQRLRVPKQELLFLSRSNFTRCTDQLSVAGTCLLETNGLASRAYSTDDSFSPWENTKVVQRDSKVVTQDQDWQPPAEKSVSIEDNSLTVAAQGSMTVTGWGHYKFKINEDFVLGSVIIFPTFVLSWNINVPPKNEGSQYKPNEKFEYPMSINELDIDHFRIFDVFRPPPELIIIGTGAKIEYPRKELLKELRKLGNIEIMDSVNACATFNMLSQEERRVAAAIIGIPDTR